MEAETGEASADELLEKARRHLTPALVFHTGIVARSASGIYVEGADNRRYMDFSSGLATTNAGHCPPAVVEAIRAQAEKLLHAGCIFYYEPVVQLAERLAGITPGDIDTFFFSNSGAEAVEGAMKLARFATGRPGVVAFTGGFHGRTTGALALTTSNVKYRRRYQPLLPSVYHSPYPYCYRCPVGRNRDSCSVECLEWFDTILKRMIPADEIACVVIEPVLGEGGYVVPPREFMVRLRDITERAGILFVADEVQSGFGRTGRWFASEHYGIKPDIITMAKGIASGLPLSAVGSTRKIMSVWEPGSHGTTFGGNPVSCAASLATIDTMEKERLLENAAQVGSVALERLRGLMDKFPFIGDVRGLGLMIGVEFVKDGKTPDAARLMSVLKKCLDMGLIIVECGLDKNIARFMPPLVVTRSEMDKALDIFEEALVA